MIQVATAEHFEFLFELYMHPAINSYLLYEPMDAIAFKPIAEDLMQQKQVYIYCTADHIAVGMFKLVPQTYRSAHIVYVGGVAIHPLFSGKGYGKQMMKDMLQYTLSKGFTRVELSVAVNNAKAIRLYQQAGFQQEGIMKKYTYLQKENIFIDEVLMAYVT